MGLFIFICTILLMFDTINCVPEYILRKKSPGTNNVRFSSMINPKIESKINIGNIEYLFASNLTINEQENLSKNYIIEKNYKASINWHLDRIDQRHIPLSKTPYKINHNNDNIDIYIIDSGIDINHPEFSNNNIVWGANFIDDINTDCNGHGTHVASLAAGKQYGVAKNANLISVKVLGCQGTGWYSGIISSIEWVVNRAKITKKISIINMSLQGPISAVLNDIIRFARINGVYVVVAAGNENQDACNYSPSCVKEIITVAASESNDKRASFSNFGSCVDMYAPGVNLVAAWPNNQYAVLSGTSMASPIASGVLSIYLSKYGRTGHKMFWGNLTTKAIKFNKLMTPNKIVYI